MTPRRLLMIGAGGHAEGWLREILPPFGDRIEVVGLVDVSEQALSVSGDFLGLPQERRFTDIATAFTSVEADFCVVSIPARFHEAAVVLAAQHGMATLCEKPLADTWDACKRIYAAVRHAGIKMEVVQNYRYTAPMLALKSVLESGELGRLNYIVSRRPSPRHAAPSHGQRLRADRRP